MEFTLGGVFIIMVICIVTTKWIMPHLTLRKMARALVRLIFRPFNKGVKKAAAALDHANSVIHDEWDKADAEEEYDRERRPEKE